MSYASRRTLAVLTAGLVLGLGACAEGDTVVGAEEEPTDPCSLRVPISVGESMSGSLGPSDCRMSGDFFADRYAFTLSSETWVQMDLQSDRFDTYLVLETASGSVVAENDDWAGLNSRITRELAAGSYVIVARSYAPEQAGSYRLTIREASDCRDRGTLAGDTAVSGALSSGQCPMPWGGSAHYWGLEVTERTELRIDLVSPDFDEVVILVDEDGVFVNGSDWGHPSGHARLETELPPGHWRLAVTAPDEFNAGDYELSVGPVPPCGPGIPVVLGEVVEGAITPEDCTRDGWLLADSLSLTLDQETDLLLEVKSQEINPIILRLADRDSNVEIWMDSWATPGLAQIREVLPAGDYAVFISTDAWGELGAYTFTATAVRCEPVGAVDFGATVSGELDAGDCRRSNGAYREDWTLSLGDETEIRIDLKSVEMDAFLVLMDGEGVVIGTNDDGGGDRNARIDTTLAAGEYRIGASSYAPQVLGSYDLTVASPPSAAAAASEVRFPSDPKAPPGVSGAGVERVRQLRERRESGTPGGTRDLLRTTGTKSAGTVR